MRLRGWEVLLVTVALSAEACGGSAEGNGDGDSTGDGDSSGDGDGDLVGDGDLMGDGDGDLGGDGDAPGDGDIVGDGDVPGDGDVGGDGDLIACDAVYEYGLHVRVIGGAELIPLEFVAPPGDGDAGDLVPPPTGGASGMERQCVASVVAVDGSYMETLECGIADSQLGDCMCYGAGERPGVYEVTATLGGQTVSQTVEVTSDACHVIPAEVIFFGPR